MLGVIFGFILIIGLSSAPALLVLRWNKEKEIKK